MLMRPLCKNYKCKILQTRSWNALNIYLPISSKKSYMYPTSRSSDFDFEYLLQYYGME